MHVSRHSLSERIGSARWLPRIPGSTFEPEGVEGLELPLAVTIGGRVGSLLLRVSTEGSTKHTSLSWENTWDVGEDICDMRLWSGSTEPEGSTFRMDPMGSVTLVLATSGGSLVTLRMKNLENSSFSNGIQGRGDREEDADVLEVLDTPHRGRISKVAVHPSTSALLSAGWDGRVCMWDPSEPNRSMEVVDASGSASFVDVDWSTRDVLLTATASGVVQGWDRRQVSGRPSCTLPMQGESSTGEPVNGIHSRADDSVRGAAWEARCLHVDYSRPHLCYAGSRDGCILVWDMRAPRPPTVLRCQTRGVGDVWSVTSDESDGPDAFLPTSAGTCPNRRLWACTETGEVLRCSLGIPSEVMYQENASLSCLDVNPTGKKDMIVASDQETLVYLSWGL